MKSLLAVLAATAVPMHLACAQTNDPALQTGARIRLVAVDSSKVTDGQPSYVRPAGSLLSIEDKFLVVRLEGKAVADAPDGDAMRVAVPQIIRAERSVGRRRHPWLGALLGIGVGATTGFLSASGGGKDGTSCTIIGGSSFCNFASGAKDARMDRAKKYAGIGAVGGAAGGFFVRTERWRLVDLGRLRVQVGLPY